MTNDELKKKILEIFEKAIGDWYEKDDGLFAEGYTPEEGDNRLKAFMADALIVAGLTFEPIIIHTFERAACSCPEMVALEDMHKEDQEYIDALLHRAKVAERALKIAVNNAYDYTYEEAIAQAKKELEEEKDNAEV